jgi:hypothetical protein
MMQESENKTLFDTAKTVLVPDEIFERGAEESYLRFNGMAPTTGEIAVATDSREGIVAVMAVPVNEWETFRKRGGGAVSSPLLSVAENRGKNREMNIALTERNFYFAVWDHSLRMAEVLPDNSIDSILYYMQVLGHKFRLKRFDIYVGGERAGLVAYTLRQYYPKVKVVSGE